MTGIGLRKEDPYFYADWYDDDVFMRGYYDDGSGEEKWHEYVKLGAKDYQIWYTQLGSVYFDVTAYDIDPDTGQHIPQKVYRAGKEQQRSVGGL